MADASGGPQFGDEGQKEEDVFLSGMATMHDPLGVFKENRAEGWDLYDPNATGDASRFGTTGLSWAQKQIAARQGAAPQASVGMYGQDARAGQMALAESLRARAAGEVPSAGEAQLRGGMDRALANQMAMKASQRGGNVGAANRLAAEQGTAMQLGTNQQAALLRAQEQAQAEQALAGLYGQTRGQDIGLRGQDVGLAQANLGAELQWQKMQDEYTTRMLQMGMTQDQAEMAARAEMERLKAQQNALLSQVRLTEAGYDVQQQAALTSAAGEGAGAVVGAVF